VPRRARCRYMLHICHQIIKDIVDSSCMCIRTKDCNIPSCYVHCSGVSHTADAITEEISVAPFLIFELQLCKMSLLKWQLIVFLLIHIMGFHSDHIVVCQQH